MNNRYYEIFPLENPAEFQWQMLNWASRFNICAFLDNHAYPGNHRQFNCMLAAGATKVFQPHTNDSLRELEAWKCSINDWAFGHFAFHLAEETEQVPQHPQTSTQFNKAFFFVPEYLFEIKDDGFVKIGTLKGNPDNIFREILAFNRKEEYPIQITGFIPRLSREEYLDKIKSLQAHIHRGDCYEINFCQEFYTRPTSFHPLTAYRLLSEFSPAPFGGFYRVDQQYVLSASPERYLLKKGNTLWSQPMKGTWERDGSNEIRDKENAQFLATNPKERAENIMIVDLVRNDLSRICQEGSVKVEELCGIYSFPQVHQMISTITGTVSPTTPFTEIIRNTFPMGSMTGAPKKRVLELTAAHETSARGIYSGALGYLSPDNDFDFNVVIRSLVYNAANNYLSYHVGSGITGYCDPEQEYRECLLKAAGILGAMNK